MLPMLVAVAAEITILALEPLADQAV